jgi:hypothetical protein
MIELEYNDGRLSEADFVAKFGNVLAMSSWGARWVGSALTRRHYIYFNRKTGQYTVEPR